MLEIHHPQNQNSAVSSAGARTTQIIARLPSALFTASLHAFVFLVFFIAVKPPENLEVDYIEVSLENFPGTASSDMQGSDDFPAPAASATQPQTFASTPKAAPQTQKGKPIIQQQRAAAPSTAQENLQANENLNASFGEGASQSSVSGAGTGQPSPLQGNPKPPYPEIARKRGQQGLVLLDVEVNERGRPTNVTVRSSSGYTLLDEAALKTIRKWQFTPAQHNGNSTSGKLLLPVEFKLED
jgi:TonB family C-terminal domain